MSDPAQKTQVCDNCGHRNPIALIFCGRCGEKIDKEEDSE